MHILPMFSHQADIHFLDCRSFKGFEARNTKKQSARRWKR
jgi:hypothetical protein